MDGTVKGNREQLGRIKGQGACQDRKCDKKVVHEHVNLLSHKAVTPLNNSNCGYFQLILY